MKKREGNIIDILSSLFLLITSFIIVTAYLTCIQMITIKADADQIARRYILDMETTGYMSVSSRTQLLQELEEISATDIDLSGTTFANVGYGNPVYLSIKCNIQGENLNTTSGNMLSFFFEDAKIPVEIYKMSTAKN